MRARRLRAPEMLFHVTARGNNRQDIFQTDDLKLAYLRLTAKIFAFHKIRLLVYCIMDNHIHFLVLDFIGGGLSLAMQKLQGTYAKFWNRREGRTGHVWGQRFHPEPVQRDEHLIVGSCYIHNNPVEAGMVRRAQEYRWSSIHAYLEGRQDDIAVSTDTLLEMCGGAEAYAKLTDQWKTVDAGDPERLPGGVLIRSLWVAGTADFLAGMKTRIERRSDRRKDDRRPKGMDLPGIFREVERQTGITRGEICGPGRARRISRARALVCAQARREGISLRLVAEEIGRTSGAVSQLADIVDLGAPSK